MRSEGQCGTCYRTPKNYQSPRTSGDTRKDFMWAIDDLGYVLRSHAPF